MSTFSEEAELDAFVRSARPGQFIEHLRVEQLGAWRAAELIDAGLPDDAKIGIFEFDITDEDTSDLSVLDDVQRVLYRRAHKACARIQCAPVDAESFPNAAPTDPEHPLLCKVSQRFRIPVANADSAMTHWAQKEAMFPTGGDGWVLVHPPDAARAARINEQIAPAYEALLDRDVDEAYRRLVSSGAESTMFPCEWRAVLLGLAHFAKHQGIEHECEETIRSVIGCRVPIYGISVDSVMLVVLAHAKAAGARFPDPEPEWMKAARVEGARQREENYAMGGASSTGNRMPQDTNTVCPYRFF